MCAIEANDVKAPNSSHSAKAGLRLQLRRARKAQAVEQPDAGTRLVRLFPESLTGPPAGFGCVAGYVPVGSEIDPRPLLRWLAARGWRTAFPAASPGTDAGPMVFKECPVDGPFVPGAWKVPEPPSTLPAVWPQMILVPLLGFDRTGGRLGQGQGHYDACIQALRAHGPVVTVGLAYAVQEVELLELEPHDQLLDWIVTEKAAYRATGRRAR